MREFLELEKEYPGTKVVHGVIYPPTNAIDDKGMAHKSFNRFVQLYVYFKCGEQTPRWWLSPESRDMSELDFRYHQFHTSDDRVEVDIKEGYEEEMSGFASRHMGRKARFYVGRSTGVRPAYLQILKSNSRGGGCAPTNILGVRAVGRKR